tara:strand:- start:1603 stop:2013 length:411 start_codon:yes stop_codon:yes gene_type:complete
MPSNLKIISIGKEEKLVNGYPVVDREFNIDINTQRNKNEEVNALIQDEDIQYQMRDSLGNFLSMLNNNNNSLFSLLKKEEKMVENPNFINNLKKKMRKRLKKTQRQSKIRSRSESNPEEPQTRKKKKRRKTLSSKK